MMQASLQPYQGKHAKQRGVGSFLQVLLASSSTFIAFLELVEGFLTWQPLDIRTCEASHVDTPACPRLY
jgi:hypothetical protein